MIVQKLLPAVEGRFNSVVHLAAELTQKLYDSLKGFQIRSLVKAGLATQATVRPLSFGEGGSREDRGSGVRVVKMFTKYLRKASPWVGRGATAEESYPFLAANSSFVNAFSVNIFLGEIFVGSHENFEGLPKVEGQTEGVVNTGELFRDSVRDDGWIHDLIRNAPPTDKLRRYLRYLDYLARVHRCPIAVEANPSEVYVPTRTLARSGFLPVMMNISVRVRGGPGFRGMASYREDNRSFLFLEDFKQVLSTLSRMRDIDASAFTFSS